jgi:hypothetical protein
MKFDDKVVDLLVERFTARLWLEKWEVNWYWQNDTEVDVYGSVTPVDNRERATIELSVTIPSFDELRRTIAHELAHLFMWNQLIIVDALESSVNEGAWAYFRQIYKDAHEKDVDTLAKMLCELCDDKDLIAVS